MLKSDTCVYGVFFPQESIIAQAFSFLYKHNSINLLNYIAYCWTFMLLLVFRHSK